MACGTHWRALFARRVHPIEGTAMRCMPMHSNVYHLIPHTHTLYGHGWKMRNENQFKSVVMDTRSVKSVSVSLRMSMPMANSLCAASTGAHCGDLFAALAIAICPFFSPLFSNHTSFCHCSTKCVLCLLLTLFFTQPLTCFCNIHLHNSVVFVKLRCTVSLTRFHCKQFYVELCIGEQRHLLIYPEYIKYATKYQTLKYKIILIIFEKF